MANFLCGGSHGAIVVEKVTDGLRGRRVGRGMAGCGEFESLLGLSAMGVVEQGAGKGESGGLQQGHVSEGPAFKAWVRRAGRV